MGRDNIIAMLKHHVEQQDLTKLSEQRLIAFLQHTRQSHKVLTELLKRSLKFRDQADYAKQEDLVMKYNLPILPDQYEHVLDKTRKALLNGHDISFRQMATGLGLANKRIAPADLYDILYQSIPETVNEGNQQVSKLAKKVVKVLHCSEIDFTPIKKDIINCKKEERLELVLNAELRAFGNKLRDAHLYYAFAGLAQVTGQELTYETAQKTFKHLASKGPIIKDALDIAAALYTIGEHGRMRPQHMIDIESLLKPNLLTTDDMERKAFVEMDYSLKIYNAVLKYAGPKTKELFATEISDSFENFRAIDMQKTITIVNEIAGLQIAHYFAARAVELIDNRCLSGLNDDFVAKYGDAITNKTKVNEAIIAYEIASKYNVFISKGLNDLAKSAIIVNSDNPVQEMNRFKCSSVYYATLKQITDK